MSVASCVSYTGHFCWSCSESLLVLIIIIIATIEMRHYFPPVFLQKNNNLFDFCAPFFRKCCKWHSRECPGIWEKRDCMDYCHNEIGGVNFQFFLISVFHFTWLLRRRINNFLILVGDHLICVKVNGLQQSDLSASNLDAE